MISIALFMFIGIGRIEKFRIKTKKGIDINYVFYNIVYSQLVFLNN